MIAVLVVEVGQVVLLVAIAAAVLGWRPGPGASPGAPRASALLLGTLAFAGLGLLMAGALRAEATLALANALFIAFLLLGGIVLPVDQLPGPLATIAGILPAAALADVFRAALGTGDVAVAVLGTATRDRGPWRSSLVWGVGAVVLAARTFRWE